MLHTNFVLLREYYGKRKTALMFDSEEYYVQRHSRTEASLGLLRLFVS